MTNKCAERLVQSLARGLDILTFASAAEDGVTQKELAARLGVKQPTVHNLAETLVAKGYLEKAVSPVRYRLGDGVIQAAHAREHRAWFRRARDMTAELVKDLNGTATVVLAEYLGGDVVVSLRMDPSRPGVQEVSPNWSLPPYRTASALCFQAFWPRPEREAYRLRYPFCEYGEAYWGDESTLAEFLQATRRAGYVLCKDAPLRCAAPVFGRGSQLLAVLGASVASDSLSELQGKRVVAKTAECASRIAPEIHL